MSALAKTCVQRVSTRKARAITEELCGASFSASTMSGISKTLDAAQLEFARRGLEEPYPVPILGARDEPIREGGVNHSQAGQIGQVGRRCQEFQGACAAVVHRLRTVETLSSLHGITCPRPR